MSGSVVLLSGGQDSAICLGWALREFGRPLVSLTIDYGQRHRKELHAARAIADIIGVDERRTIKLDLGGSIRSALTEPRVEVAAEGGINNLPTTYVPGRNGVFLWLAAGVAQTRAISNIVIGCCEIDYSGYPDCREAFLSGVQANLQLGLAYPALELWSPLIFMSKRDALLKFARPYDDVWRALAHSWTCYHGGSAPCGNCPSCLLRQQSFSAAGYEDPALRFRSALEGDPNP